MADSGSKWTHHGEWSSRLLDYDPQLRRKTIYWYNQYDQTQRITEEWDVSQIVAANKARYAATDERASWSHDDHELGTHVGSIPLSIAFDVLRETGWGKDRAAVSRWLRDPENRHFLSRPVRLGV